MIGEALARINIAFHNIHNCSDRINEYCFSFYDAMKRFASP
jgi:hypothetical protein